MSVINRNSGSPVFNTLAEAVAANMTIGQLPVVLGTSAAFDGGGKIYVVLANGSGGTAMNNGNELVAFTDTGAVTTVGTAATKNTGTASGEVPLNSDGSGIAQLNASNLASGTVPSARLNILGTVSQSGGVPTGAIIEEYDANGGLTQVIKFADGTMIIVQERVDSNFNVNISEGSGFTATSKNGLAYPESFSSTPEIVQQIKITDASGLFLVSTTTTTPTAAVSCGYRIQSLTSLTNVSVTVTQVSIGRWFA